MFKQSKEIGDPCQGSLNALAGSSRIFKGGFALVGFLSLMGCDNSPYAFAPVSGVVTLDGDPLAEARVTFLPRASEGQINAGPSSTSVTDNEGRFEMVTLNGNDGAIVGTHRVRISTYREEGVEGKDKVNVVAKEKVPKRYNVKTKLSFEVPSDGNSNCNFSLQSKGRIAQTETN